MKMTIRFFLATFFLVLSSCSNGKRDVTKMWAESVNYFDGGKVDKAFKVAQDIGRYDTNSSDYLLSQYAIYEAAANGLNFYDGMENTYKKVLNLDKNVDPTYRGHYIVVQVFAQRFLHGKDASAALLSIGCKSQFNLDSPHCVDHLLRDASNVYVGSYGRLDAVYLYEIARISFDLKLADKQISNFYMGLALVQIDNLRANFVLRDMSAHGFLTVAMKKEYCGFIKGVSVKEVAISCGA